MEEDIIHLCYIKFAEKTDQIPLCLPYILGEYYMKSPNVSSHSSKVDTIGKILTTLSKDKLKTSIFVKNGDLEERISLLEEMAKKISFSRKNRKF